MQAVTLPITLPRWAKPAYYAVISLLALVGVVAVVIRLIYGMKVTALTSPHFPSLWEWASTVGLTALIVLGFSVAYKLLPVFGIVEEKFSGGER